MVVTTPSTIMPTKTCDNYKTKKCILRHWPHCNLDPWAFDPKIWKVHPCPEVRHWRKFGQIPWTNTQDILLTMFVRDARTLGKHNASTTTFAEA